LTSTITIAVEPNFDANSRSSLARSFTTTPSTDISLTDGKIEESAYRKFPVSRIGIPSFLLFRSVRNWPDPAFSHSISLSLSFMLHESTQLYS
jgi:hypothetical protein